MSSRNVLVCAPCMPEHDRESGSRRIADLLELLREAGWAVTFASTGPGEARYIAALEQRGIETYAGDTIAIDRIVATRSFDLAILAFWHVAEIYLPRIRAAWPHTRVVVDSIDLHFMRNARQIFTGALGATGNGMLHQGYADEMVRELNVYAAADAVWTVSQKEADLVNDIIGDNSLAASLQDMEDLQVSSHSVDRRKGIVFLGNFRHAPNRDAVHFLFREVMPHIHIPLLEEHPLYVVGNALDEDVRRLAEGHENVHMVGWVPSVVPYLERTRVSLIPLRYGAGTKRKLIQSLMIGTPSVSTSVGVEGLSLHDGEQVLVADNPVAFARSIESLLIDDQLWMRLAENGRAHITATHGHEAVRSRFQEVVGSVLCRMPKRPLVAAADSSRARLREQYPQIKPRIRQLLSEALPHPATVLVVSKGDDELLDLDAHVGWHFPQHNGGVYAGSHPANSTDAIEHLERLRAKGAEFLLFPNTAFWWLDHYAEFKQHLDSLYRRIITTSECVVYQLSEVNESGNQAKKALPLSDEALGRLRPVVPSFARFRDRRDGVLKNVLVIGIYLAREQNTADHVISTLAESKTCRVTQRWVALGGEPPTQTHAEVTVKTILEKTPKFQIVNDLLAKEDLAQYDYVVMCDDDIVLPQGFMDDFIPLQDGLDFAIAQPARTSNSYIDHPIVEQQRGVLARQTLFVEIGPVVSFHRSVFDFVFPFDLTSSMGWGYENVWSYLLTQRGLKLGIIDAVPVDHSLRKPVAYYSWDEANRGRKEYLKKHRHFPLDQCFHVINVSPLTADCTSSIDRILHD